VLLRLSHNRMNEFLRKSWELFFLIKYNMEEENEYLEKIEYILGNLSLSLEELNSKILWWWKIIGLVFLGFLLVVGYVFCTTSGHLVVLGFVGIILMCGWFIINSIIKKKIMMDQNFIIEFREMTEIKLYIIDSFITSAIEIKAKGSYSRDKLQEIKDLCESLNTEEGVRKAETILKALDINLSDIKWMEGNKTGIRVVK